MQHLLLDSGLENLRPWILVAIANFKFIPRCRFLEDVSKFTNFLSAHSLWTKRSCHSISGKGRCDVVLRGSPVFLPFAFRDEMQGSARWRVAALLPKWSRVAGRMLWNVRLNYAQYFTREECLYWVVLLNIYASIVFWAIGSVFAQVGGNILCVGMEKSPKTECDLVV